MAPTVRDSRCINRRESKTKPYHLYLQLKNPKIIHSVLKSAAKETQEDEDFENRWSLISHPSQLTITKPSVFPLQEPLQTGFLDASVETLQEFVAGRCGENGLGHESEIYMDWLADDAFGVIDARTAEDETILFCVRETVDAMQEAEVRLAWDKGMDSPYQILWSNEFLC
jgi:hypothetical protein